jgi:hypothetical protein
MAASPKITPQVEHNFETRIIKTYERGPKPPGRKQRIRVLLAEIFEEHEEFLGWTPD